MIYKITLFGLVLSLIACQKNSLKPSAYNAFVRSEDSGLSKKRQIGDLKYEVTYCPTAYMVANELRRDDITQVEYDTLKQKFEDSHYIILKIGLNTPDAKRTIENYRLKDDSELDQRLYYLSFAMQDDLRLLDGTDTLNPALFHYERSYDLAPYRTFMVIFLKENKIPIIQIRHLL